MELIRTAGKHSASVLFVGEEKWKAFVKYFTRACTAHRKWWYCYCPRSLCNDFVSEKKKNSIKTITTMWAGLGQGSVWRVSRCWRSCSYNCLIKSLKKTLDVFQADSVRMEICALLSAFFNKSLWIYEYLVTLIIKCGRIFPFSSSRQSRRTFVENLKL